VTRSIAGRQRNVRLGAAAVGIAAIFAAATLAGCSAGQVSETASIVSAVPGGSASLPVPTKQNPNGALLINNVIVDSNGTAGYAAGSTAALSMTFTNQSTVPVTVTVGAAQLISAANTRDVTALGSMSLSGGAPDIESANSAPNSPPTAAAAPAPAATPSSAKPGESAGPAPSESASIGPTTVTIQPGMIAILSTSVGPDTQHVQIPSLQQAVMPGDTVMLTFNVTSSDSEPQSTQIVAPVAPPMSAAPRVSASGFPPSVGPST
jgi:hypothetical protein